MSKIPTKLSEEQFKDYVEPYLGKAKRGYICSIPLYKVFNYILYVLHTGCQWKELVTDPHPTAPEKKEITYHGVYHHFRKWSKDGSLTRVWENSIGLLEEDGQIDSTVLNLDGSHTIAKKGAKKSLIKDVRRPRRVTYCP